MLESNEPAYYPEKPHLMNAYTTAKKDKKWLEEHIFHLENHVIPFLKQKLAVVDTVVSEHAAVLSPLRSLPVEILLRIMSFYVGPGPDDLLDLTAGTNSAWRLAQVSQRFRTVALATPSLWSNIKIDLRDKERFLDPQFHGVPIILATYITRSKQLPLTISFASNTATDLSKRVAEVLIHHRSRWHDVTLDIPGKVMDGTLTRPFTDVPLLESLGLNIAFLRNHISPVTVFQHAPRLKAVKLFGASAFTHREAHVVIPQPFPLGAPPANPLPFPPTNPPFPANPPAAVHVHMPPILAAPPTNVFLQALQNGNMTALIQAIHAPPPPGPPPPLNVNIPHMPHIPHIFASPMLATNSPRDISARLLLPWNQLTTLDIEFAAFGDFYPVLKQAINVVDCRLTSKITTRRLPPDMVTLSKLRSLRLSGTAVHILERLLAPSLKRLKVHESETVNTTYPIPNQSGERFILPFISMSSCNLHQLSFQSLPLTEHVLDIIKGAPTVASLSLDVYLKNRNDSALFDVLLSALTYAATGGPQRELLLPRMKSLSLSVYSKDALHASAVVEMVKSRRNIPVGSAGADEQPQGAENTNARLEHFRLKANSVWLPIFDELKEDSGLQAEILLR
ncbi:hypothetical protein AAF712_005209 [Marasmius tenuissimus]|uniref:F-box domain-containing protein n=1 Tax=Marasmius tenuissimus TaxID=585030 RepID=A0ABR3A3A0_9AGAR